MHIDILYHDNHLLAANKPPDLLTQPSGTDRDNLEDQAKAWVKAEFAKPGAVFLEAVHRIDSPVSGVVLFGRTSKALTRMNAAIRERRVRKQYLAIVRGRLPKDSDTLVNHLRHDDHQATVVPAGTKGAAEARLHYRVLHRGSGSVLVEIDLETGRYHQIRVQLAAIDCPILGDTRYGGPEWRNPGIALHHRRLSVPHPTRPDTIVIDAPEPPGWRRVLN